MSQKFSVTDSPAAKLEMVVEKGQVKSIVGIISEYGKTLNPGDGVIYVSDVNWVYRVKNGLKNGE